MAEYSFKCSCGRREAVEASVLAGPVAPVCHGDMKRNYKAEGMTANMRELRREREGINAALVLPTAADYKGPTDPDGTKGLRQWNEDHSPKGHSGRTRPGGREMKVSY